MAHAPAPRPASELPRHLLQRLASSQEMRAMDAHAIGELGLPGRLLMENAAHAMARRVAALLTEGKGPARGPVAVCCGGGNNGGDGYAAARLLANRGLDVTVLHVGEPGGDDARANAQAWAAFGATLDAAAEPALAREVLRGSAAVVDALFGTGLSREVSGPAADLIAAVNEAVAETGAPVVAVDVPSGVNSDTGQVLGRAVRCTHTVTFQVAKPGCYQFPGAALAGEVEVAPISIPPVWPDGAPGTWRLTPPGVAALLPPRPADGHKGTFGHLLTVCGSAGMGGAALMSSLAGLKIGAGLVTAGVPRCLRDRFLTAAPELMTLASEEGPAEHFAPAHAPALLEAAAQRSAVVLGCGVGRSKETGAFVQRVVAGLSAPLLIDADGLYALQPRHLQARPGPTVITPHPGELARLAGLEREALGADRLGVARHLAAEWNVVLVLKGAGTVIADPSGEAFLNPTGDAGLASGGTGDVLSGLIGGLLAQGLEALPAALLGVYLHGLARDCQRESVTGAYFTAADLIAGINPALQRLGAD